MAKKSKIEKAKKIELTVRKYEEKRLALKKAHDYQALSYYRETLHRLGCIIAISLMGVRMHICANLGCRV